MRGSRPEIIGPLVALLSTSSCRPVAMEELTVSRDLSNPAVLAETELEIRNYSKYPCAEEIRNTLETVHEFVTGEPAAQSEVAFICLDKEAEYEGTPVDVLVQSDGLGDTFALTDPYSFWVQMSNYPMGSDERESFVRSLTVCAKTEGCLGLSLDTEGSPVSFPPQVRSAFEENFTRSDLGAVQDSGIAREALIENPESFNVLLMGKHDTLVDTLILAHIDEVRKKITLISVPRDLYYGGRKINAYYGKKGIEGQVTAVEEVLGQKIRDYVLIDMYDFRDLIDLMGGVDIVLEKDLVDKTYKTRDGDTSSTLNYPAGPHHLNGTESLRIARSRHSSSDFSRAARQQIVLEAIRTKISALGLGDAETVSRLFLKAVELTKTDIELKEAATYYYKYRGFEVDGAVLSSSNVLTGSLIPVPYKSDHIVHTCVDDTLPETCTDTPVMDALVPRGGDWTLITKYVDSVLNPPEKITTAEIAL